MDYIEEGRKVLIQEAEGLRKVADKLGDDFKKAVDLLHNCRGRVIVIGIGKSGIIGRKIAATLTSIGTPAFFLHPSEAVHGDLGIVTKEDVVILISKSGETDEIKNILPNLKLLGIQAIGITGNPKSTLGGKCDLNLDLGVSREADPDDLIPTTSTSAALAIGDALAVVLLKLKKLKPEDLALLHPGGVLGKKLTLTVGDLMYKGEKVPKVLKNATVKEAIFQLTEAGLGITGVVEKDDTLVGIFTDGDLRRLIEKGPNFIGIEISKVMTPHPKTISESELAINALKKMKNYRITALMVTDEKNKLIGVLNIHFILRAGIA